MLQHCLNSKESNRCIVLLATYALLRHSLFSVASAARKFEETMSLCTLQAEFCVVLFHVTQAFSFSISVSF